MIDAADPERDARIGQVEAVLTEIGADAVTRLEVYNKLDLKPDEAPRVERDADGRPARVYVSALTGAGLDLLGEAVAELLGPEVEEHTLTLPPSAARLRARLFEQGAVRSEKTRPDGGFRLRVVMPRERLARALKEAGLEPSGAGLR